MCDCFHLAFPNWHGPATGPGRRLRGPEQDTEDDSVFEEPEILERERPRPQGSSPIEEFPAEKQVEEDIYDTQHKSGSNKKSRRVGFGSLFDKRATVKMSEDIQIGESGMILKTVKEVCAEGLVLTGGGKEGIFIKEVKPDSPASKHLSMKEGDQILSATVYFDNVSCEDALQILDHAHPYKMEFCLRRKVESTMPEDAEIIHPEGNKEGSPEMRIQRKMKKQQDRISWPKFPSFGKGRRAQFKRSHSTSEAEEHRKLEMSPPTSDTESPLKSPLKFPDGKDKEKKQKMHLNVTMKGYRSKSVEEPQRKEELITENLAAWENQQVDIVEEKYPEEATAKLVDIAHVVDDAENEVSSKIKQDHAFPSLSETELKHKVHFISLGNTLKTTDISITFAEGSADIVTLEEGKIERSEMKVNIRQKEKTDTGTGSQSGENRISDISASDHVVGSPVVILQPESERFQLDNDINTQEVNKDSSDKELVSINKEINIPKLDNSLELSSVGELEKSLKTCDEKQLKERNIFENESYGIRIRGPLADMATTKPHFSSTVDGFQFLLPESSGNKQESTIIDIQESSFAIPDISQAKFKTDSAISAVEMKDLEIRTSKLPTETNIDHLLADVDRRLESKFKLPNVDLSKLATQDPIKMTKIEQIKTYLPNREDIEIPGIESKESKLCLQTPVFKVPKIEKVPNITKEEKIRAQQTGEEFNVQDVKEAVSKFPAFKLPEGDVTGVLVQREVTIMEMKGEKTSITPRGSPCKISVTSADSSTTIYKSQIGKDKSSASDIADKDMGIKIPNVELHYNVEQSSIAVKKTDYTKPNIQDPKTKIDRMLITGDEKIGEVTFKLPKREDIEIPGMEAIKKSNTQKTKMKVDKDAENAAQTDKMSKKPKTKKYVDQIEQEKKSKKTKVSMQSFGITKPDIRFPDIGTDLPKKYIHKNDTGEKKMKKFEVDVPQTDTKLKDVSLAEATNLKQNTMETTSSRSDRKFGKKEAEIPIHEKSIMGKGLPEKKGPQSVNMDEKIQNIEIGGQGSKFKLPKFEISFPEVKVPKMHFSPSKKDTEFAIAEGNIDMPAAYSPDVEIPDAKTKIKEDTREVDSKGHEVKTKHSSFSFPKFGFSKSDTKITEADVHLRNTEGFLPEGNADMEVMNAEITLSIGDTSQENETKFGSPTKFKLPSISFPKFGAKAPKAAEDISDIDAQSKGPEISLSQAEVTVSDEPLSVYIKGPDVDKKIGKSLKPDTKVQDIQTEGQESKFKLPKFEISLPDVGGLKTDLSAGKTETDISAPEGKREVHASDVEVPDLKTKMKSNISKVDSKGQEAEIKKPVFSFPRFGFSKSETKSPETDLSPAQVDVSLPGENVKLQGTTTDITFSMVDTEEEDKMNFGSPTKFKLPSISLPKFAAKATKDTVDISAVDDQIKENEIKGPELKVSVEPLSVHIKGPETDTNEKSVNIEMKAQDIQNEGQKSKFKLPKFGTSFPELKGPKIDLHVEKTDTDISLSVGKGDIHVHNVQVSDVKTEVLVDLPDSKGHEVKMDKPGFSFPKFGFSKSETKAPEGDVSLPQVGVSLPGEHVKMEEPNTEITLFMGDTVQEDETKFDSPKFKFPSISFPKFGAKSPKKAIDISTVDVQRKDLEISLPQREVVVSSEPLSVDTKPPGVDNEEKSLIVKIKAEDMKTEGQERKFKLPKSGISLPEVKGPKIDLQEVKTEMGISLPEGKGEVHALDVEMPDVKTEVKLDLPIVDSKGLKVEMKKPGFSLPKMGYSKSEKKESETDVTLPQVHVPSPGENVKIEGPNADIKIAMGDTGEEEKNKFGSSTKFKLPTISLPKFGSKATKEAVDISAVDVKMKGPEIHLPQAEVGVPVDPIAVEIKEPDKDNQGKSLSVDMKAQDVQIEGEESKFKLPKFGISFPEVKGPKIDLHGRKTETDISLPEGKGEIHGSYAEASDVNTKVKTDLIEVDLKSLEIFSHASKTESGISLPYGKEKRNTPDVEVPDVKTEVKVDLPKVDSKGLKVEMKKPGFSLPRIGFSKSETKESETDASLIEVHVSLPGENVNIEGPNADINVAMGDTREQDKMKVVGEPKFKLTSISLQKFGSKDTKEAVDSSVVDGQIRGPEISLPITEVKVSAECVSPDVKVPETKKDEKSVNTEMKGQDIPIEGHESMFKLPKFGISLPELKGPKMHLHAEKIDTDVSLPEGKREVHAANVQVPDVKTEVQVDLPKVDSKGLEVKMDKLGFSFPRFGFSKSETKAPEGDVSLPQVDVSLPVENVRMEEPHTEIKLSMGDTGQEIETKFGSPKFKLPSISLPKFGAKTTKKGTDISAVDVQMKGPEISLPQTEALVSSQPLSLDIKAPEVDKEEKSLNVDIKDEDIKTEWQESKFKLPKFGISLPEVKGPKTDLRAVKTEIDIVLLEGKGEVHALDVEVPDVKTEVKLDLPNVDSKGLKLEMKKPGFSLPKFGFSKSETKESEGNVSLPQVAVSLPGENVKIEEKNSDIKLAVGNTREDDKIKLGSSTKFKLPSISFPKFESKATKDSVDISAVDVKIKGPEISLQQAEVRMPADPIAVEIKEPDKDNQGKSLSVDMKVQDIQIEGQESKFKLPKFGISLPEERGPKIDFHERKTETDISVLEGKGGVYALDVEVPDVKTEVTLDLPKGDSKGLEVKMKEPGFSFAKFGFYPSEVKEPKIHSQSGKNETDSSLPEGKGEVHTSDVEMPDVKRKEVKGNLPEVDSKGLEVKIKKPVFSFPKFGFSKSETNAPKADMNLPNVDAPLQGENIKIEETHTDITIPMVDSGKEIEIQVSTKPLSTDIKGPEINKDGKSLDVEMKAQDIQIEEQERKFKLPKFGISIPDVKRPKTDLHASKTVTDISLPEGKGEVKTPGVEIAGVKTKMKVDLPEADSKDIEIKMKKPVFSFPKFGFSKSETNAPKADVNLPNVDAPLQGENIKIEETHTDITIPMVDSGKEDKIKFGSPTKIKLPSISLPKFGGKATKEAVDISAVDEQMKQTEIGFPEIEIQVSAKPLSTDIKGPEINKDGKSLDVEMKAQDIQIEEQEKKFKLPKFGISIPDVKRPKTDLHASKTVTDISLPEGKGEVKTPGVEIAGVKTKMKVDLPEADSKDIEIKMKKPVFSFPKFGFSKSETNAPKADVNLPNVDAPLQGENIKIEETHTDITIPMVDSGKEDKIKFGSPTKIKLPSISLPKFGGKATKEAVDISAVDEQMKQTEIGFPEIEIQVSTKPLSTDIQGPEINKDGKSLDVEMKAQDIQIEEQEKKFKLPKFGISIPDVKRPKTNLHASKTVTDISLPEGKGEVKTPGVEIASVKTKMKVDLPEADSKDIEIKMKKPGFSFPKFGFSKSESKAPEADVNLPQVDISLRGDNLKMEGPNAEVTLSTGDTNQEYENKFGSPTKFKQSTISLPKFGSKATKEAVEISAMDVQINDPVISLPQAEVRVAAEPVAVDIKGPEIDKQGKSLNADMKAQDLQIEGQESRIKFKFGISIPEERVPKIDLHGSKTETDISLQEGKGEIHGPNAEVPDVKPKVKLDLPEVDSKGLEVKIKKPGFSFPKFVFSKSETKLESKVHEGDAIIPHGDVSLPGENVKMEGKNTDITHSMDGTEQIDETKFGSPTKFKLPSISLPKFGVKTPKEAVDISAMDVQIKSSEIHLPQAEVKVSAQTLTDTIRYIPEVPREGKHLNVDIKAQDIKTEGQESKFKLPNFGISLPQVKGQKIDLHASKTETAISAPEVKREEHALDVELPDVKTEVKLDLPKVDSKGFGVEMKKPGFSLPKFGFSKSETTATEENLTQADIALLGENVQMEGPNTEITLSTGDTGQEDENRFGSPKFYLPSISLPKFGGKSSKPTQDCSAVDGQSKGPEISLTEGGIKGATEPEIDIEGRCVNIEMKAQDIKIEGQESKFKLPKFDISLPELKGPKITLHAGKTETDISLPDGKGEMHAHDVEVSDIKSNVKVEVDSKGLEIKMKKPGFSFPKFFSKTETKVPEADSDVSLPAENTKIRGPNADIKISIDDTREGDETKIGSPAKFKLPSISLPTFGSKATKDAVDISAVDVQMKGPEIHLPQAEVGVPVDPIAVGIKGPNTDKQGKPLNVDIQDTQTEGQESKFKLPQFGISLPEVKGPKIILCAGKTKTDISLPEGEGEGHASDVEMPFVKTDVKVNLPEVDSKDLEVKIKRSGFSVTRFGLSKTETKAPEPGPRLLHVDPLSGQNIQMEETDITLSMSDTAQKGETKFDSPKFKLPPISLPKFRTKASKAALDSSAVDVEVERPEISLPEELKVSAKLLSVDLKGPGVDKDGKSCSEIDITDINTGINARSDHIKQQDSKTEAEIIDKVQQPPEATIKHEQGDKGSPSRFKDPTIKMPMISISKTQFQGEQANAATSGNAPEPKHKENTQEKTSKFTMTKFSDVLRGFDVEFSVLNLDEIEQVKKETTPTKQEYVTGVKGEESTEGITTNKGGAQEKSKLKFRFPKLRFSQPSDEGHKMVNSEAILENSEKQSESQPDHKVDDEEKQTKPEKSGWFRLPKLSSPTNTANINEKEDSQSCRKSKPVSDMSPVSNMNTKEAEKSSTGEVEEDTISPTLSLRSSEAFADISAQTTEQVGLSLASPTKIKVKYFEPTIEVSDMHGDVITSTTRTELISLEPHQPEKVNIPFSADSSSSSSKSLKQISGEVHIIMSNVQTVPDTQHATILTYIDSQVIQSLPPEEITIKSDSVLSVETARVLKEEHTFVEEHVEEMFGNDNEKVRMTSRMQVFEGVAAEPFTDDTASSVQKLKDIVHTEKM